MAQHEEQNSEQNPFELAQIDPRSTLQPRYAYEREITRVRLLNDGRYFDQRRKELYSQDPINELSREEVVLTLNDDLRHMLFGEASKDWTSDEQQPNRQFAGLMLIMDPNADLQALQTRWALRQHFFDAVELARKHKWNLKKALGELAMVGEVQEALPDLHTT